ncbi:MAG: capsular polysaccharide biosynthesis protein, partial [Pseudomonadota bacterium]
AALTLARRLDASIAVWGADRARIDRLRGAGAEVVALEDGFVRSIGLGVEHERPVSLVAARHALHFETDRETDLDRILARGCADPERGCRLLERLRDGALTKYLDDRTAPRPSPPKSDRTRVLVVGQVNGDASLRFGGGYPGGNLALIEAARRRWPEGFLLYKPHPDVVSGLRPDPDGEAIAAIADAVAPEIPPLDAAAWAEVVETMTSQLGLEALIHAPKKGGPRVVCHGRPFYAARGLTEDLAPPRGGRAVAEPPVAEPPAASVDLARFAHAAFIDYPRYVTPGARIPCPPEVALELLDAARGRPRSAFSRLRKRAMARLLSLFP